MALPTETDITTTSPTPLRMEAVAPGPPVATQQIEPPVAAAPQPGDQIPPAEQAPAPQPDVTPPAAPAELSPYEPTPESLPRIQKGLVSMLSEENELRELAAAKGMRIGSRRGLGASSFAARAGVGAELDYVTPIVTQAEQFDVQKELQAQAHLANKYQQDADIEFQRWAKEADLSHLQLLEGNRSAATAGQNYSSQLANIYADPATTTLQKQEAARLLSNTFTQNLELIEATSKIDLSKFLPDFVAQQTERQQRQSDPLQAELDDTITSAGWAVSAPGTGDFDVGGYGVTDTTGTGRSLADLGAAVGPALSKYAGTFTAGSMLGGPAVGAVAVAARAAYDAYTGGSGSTAGGPDISRGYGEGPSGGDGGVGGPGEAGGVGMGGGIGL